MTLRAAVIGAGPSGFYATDQLVKAGFEVDLYDALPTPFGLVRAGVAPDHPKIKSVTRVYEKTAARDGFRFFGGVELGTHITREDLLERYHAILYAVGTSTDNRLGIPGEQLDGSHAATEFVAWYNGHPAYADRRFDLTAERAVVIGNGNVALDVARMLVLTPDELAPTDTADHALDALAAARVQEVAVLGRRGPAQAAFTNPELLELGELSRADVVVDPADLEGIQPPAADTTKRRNVEILREYAGREAGGKSHRIALRFLRSPVEILGDAQGRVRGVRVVRNELDADGRAVPTGDEEVIECGLVLRSIGYRGVPLDGIPFDERRGLIRNDDGRVVDDNGTALRGEYAVGWIKRGPSGVIGTNKKCAADTVTAILDDAGAHALNVPGRPDRDTIEPWLRERAPALVTWSGWQAIDHHERGRGEASGRPRVKLTDVDDMVAVASEAFAA
jgi:ferredoxin/flavodoxin---NADP+ reductase